MLGPSVLLLGVVGGALAQTPFQISQWKGSFAPKSGVLSSLRPASEPGYDFSPSDYLQYRNGPRNYHTGDIAIRWRTAGQSDWSDFDTAALRDSSPPVNEKINGSLLHSTWNTSSSIVVTRDWKVDGGDLVLSARVNNPSTRSKLELGSFGFPIEFNSIFFNRSADETTAKCNLIDPYIGLDAGYVQVTRLTGTGPNLVITPYNNQTKFEAWRFLFEDGGPPLYYQTQTFEGFYSWEVLSKAYAENEWRNTQPWNLPTSQTLNPGESITFALRFSVAKEISGVESVVSGLGRPVAVGVPGYVVPTDLPAQLFLKHTSSVKSINVSPIGAFRVGAIDAAKNGWVKVKLTAANKTFGRVRVTIVYADESRQTVHYFVTKSTLDTAASLADFFFDKAWFTDTSDPFKRAKSIITYDYEAGAQVQQDPRVWIAGIADEAGSVYEALALKTAVHPVAGEVAKLEEMVATSIWGGLQNIGGDTPYGVKRSLFFYEPSAVPNYTYSQSIDWGGSWNRNDAFSVWRAYDYVHVSALYYSLYRAERVSPGILSRRPASWYLEQAYQTVVASQAKYPDGTPITAYADVGLMGETLWTLLLRDLRAENQTSEAQNLESIMRGREQVWTSQSSPFGSEMAWDSTGQEPIYAWARYFKDAALQNKVLDSIRGYMPTVAHWGWNGNARRYWDFLYGGKTARIERMIHHYGSGLNSLPLLNAYKYSSDPTGAASLHDLRVGYGGHMGALTNVNAEGFAATAFHSWPDTMSWDGYSGDYGPNYLGHILGAATFLVQHSDFGWISFGGIVSEGNGQVTVLPRDSVRRSIYVASIGLSTSVDGGVMTKFVYTPGSKKVDVYLDKAAGINASTTVMFFESTLGQSVKLLTAGLMGSKGGYIVKLPSVVSFAV